MIVFNMEYRKATWNVECKV